MSQHVNVVKRLVQGPNILRWPLHILAETNFHMPSNNGYIGSEYANNMVTKVLYIKDDIQLVDAIVRQYYRSS